MIGRWLVGWCFPKGDLDILDEPIPESLYCKCKRDCHRDIEKGPLEEESRESSAEAKETEADMSSTQQKVEHDINITEEVDRCQLWRHMVHKLDNEPSAAASSKSQLRNRGSEGKPSSAARKNLIKTFEAADEQKRDEPVELTGFESVTIHSTTV